MKRDSNKNPRRYSQPLFLGVFLLAFLPRQVLAEESSSAMSTSTAVETELAAPTSSSKVTGSLLIQAVSNMKAQAETSRDATVQSLNVFTLGYKVTEKTTAVVGGQFEYNAVPRPENRLLDDSQTPGSTSQGKPGYVPRDPFVGFSTTASSILGSDEASFLTRFYVPVTSASILEKRNGTLRLTGEVPWTINKLITLSYQFDPRLVFTAGNETLLSFRNFANVYVNLSDKVQLYHLLGFIQGLGQMGEPEAGTEAHSLASGFKASETFENETGISWNPSANLSFIFSVANSTPVQGYDASGVGPARFRWYHSEDTDYNLYTTLSF